MKKLLIGASLLLLSQISFALPIVLGDVLSDTHSLTNSTIVDSEDQIFSLTDLSIGQNDATAFLLFEGAGNKDYNSFGIVGSNGSGGLTHLEVFNPLQNAVSDATLSWNTATNEVTNLATSISAMIDELLFGFYIETKNDGFFYSINGLNVGGADLMASFDTTSVGSSLFGSDFILGFEDTLGGDLDYNDIVVGISDITAVSGVTTFDTPTSVPEPSPFMLMGLGLLGMVGAVRAKNKNDKTLIAMRA